MPTPNPTKDESKKDFIPRCISILTREGDRYTNSQRIVICYDQWKNRKKEKGDTNMKLTLDKKLEDIRLPKVSEAGTTGTIAGQYDEIPPLPEDVKLPKTHIEELEEELRSP